MKDVINTNYEPEVKQALEEMKELKEKKDRLISLLEQDFKNFNLMIENIEVESSIIGEISLKDLRKELADYKKKKQKVNDDIMRGLF